jgi:hypothetical protein
MRKRIAIHLRPPGSCGRCNHHRSRTYHAELALQFGSRSRRIQWDTNDAAPQAGEIRDDKFDRIATQERHPIASTNAHGSECSAHSSDVFAQFTVRRGVSTTDEGRCGCRMTFEQRCKIHPFTPYR